MSKASHETNYHHTNLIYCTCIQFISPPRSQKRKPRSIVPPNPIWHPHMCMIPTLISDLQDLAVQILQVQHINNCSTIYLLILLLVEIIQNVQITTFSHVSTALYGNKFNFANRRTTHSLLFFIQLTCSTDVNCPLTK